MSGVTVTIDDAAVRGALNRLTARLSDLTPVMRDVGELLVQANWGRFTTQAAPDGRPWEPLKPATVRRKRLSWILMETSRLRDSLVARPGPATVVVGTNAEYAAIHQFGGEIRRPAHTRTVRLRLTPQGELLRQIRRVEGEEPVVLKNLARFARKHHKRVRERQVKVPAYTITIPARPFLGASKLEQRRVVEILSEWMHAVL